MACFAPSKRRGNLACEPSNPGIGNAAGLKMTSGQLTAQPSPPKRGNKPTALSVFSSSV